MPTRQIEYVKTAMSGNVSIVTRRPSDDSVIRSPFFSQEEKVFFEETMKNEEVKFGLPISYVKPLLIQHSQEIAVESCNYRIFLKRFVHDSALAADKSDNGNIFFLHDTSTINQNNANFQTSWSLVKFAIPLYRTSFNCLLVDLPGFGTSEAAGEIGSGVEKWKYRTADILSNLMAFMKSPNSIDRGFARSKFVTFGSSASYVLELAIRNAYLIDGRCIFICPDVTDFLTNNGVHGTERAASGSSTDLINEHSSRIIASTLTNNESTNPFIPMIRFLRTRLHCNICVVLDSSKSAENNLETFSLNRSFFLALETDPVLSAKVKVIEIQPNELEPICLFQPSGVTSVGMRPIYALKPSRYLRVYLQEFLSGTRLPPYTAPPDTATIAKHKQHQLQLMKHTSKSEGNKYSFGARLKELEDQKALSEVMALSAKEYTEEFGDEEQQFTFAAEDSIQAFNAEQQDESLKQRREDARREQTDAVFRLRQIQDMIDQTNEYDMLAMLSDDSAVAQATANSKLQTNLEEMLQEQDTQVDDIKGQVQLIEDAYDNRAPSADQSNPDPQSNDQEKPDEHVSPREDPPPPSNDYA